MLERHTIRRVWRVVTAPFRHAVAESPATPEFQQVNAVCGIEPLRPELSGLRVRSPVRAPGRMACLLVNLRYRWRPSAEYRRRQAEMQELNRWLKRLPRKLGMLPPISYVDETAVFPLRFQPLLDGPNSQLSARGDVTRELGDLEAVARLHTVRTIQPRLPEPDPEYLLAFRPLLPRHYRQFLRHSLYLRLGAGLAAVVATIAGILWVSQIQQAEAIAAGRFHVARHAFQAELDSARAYGVDPRVLWPLEVRSRALNRLQAPSSLIPTRARARFYSAQERRYTTLLYVLRRLERQALRYWTWREGSAYAALVEATREANRMGLPETLPPVPSCQTPHCYRVAVGAQSGRAAWLGQTAATLRVYGAAVLASEDPAFTAGNELQEARTLHAILPGWATPPARLANLDGMYATAARPAEYARVGALAHLDVDALRTDLVRALPPRAVVVSVEEQELTCYDHGRAACRSPVSVDSVTPTGIFHIQAKQISLPALYWHRFGNRLVYRNGALPDWMPFSGGAALQGAPWRSVFGPGSDAFLPLYTPFTPGSVDLPPATARFVFGWVAVGTEVVVY